MAGNIHKLTLDGKTIIPATTTDAVLHPGTSTNLSNLIDCYDVTRIFPRAGIDGGDKYTLKSAIDVLGTSLTSEQMLKGITIKFQDQSGKVLKYEYQGVPNSSSDFKEVSNWINIFNPPIGTVLLSGMGNVFGSDWERCTRILNPKEWKRYYYDPNRDNNIFGIPFSKVYGGGKIIINEMDINSSESGSGLTESRIEVSSDGGETWETSVIGTEEMYISMCYFEKTRTYISISISNLDDELNVHPSYSTDGISWSNPPINPWSDLTGGDNYPYYLIAGENYVVAVGNNKAYITDMADGVNSVWKEESFSFETHFMSYLGTGNLGMFDKNTKSFIFLAGEYVVTRNDNPGGSWEKRGKWSPATGTTFLGANIFFDSGRDRYVINNIDGVIISTDKTLNSWEQIYKNNLSTSNFLIRTISVTEDGSIYLASRLDSSVFGSGSSNGLYKGTACFSIDGGYTWYENSLGAAGTQNYDNISTPDSIITIVSRGIFKAEIPEIDENGIPYGYIKVR